MRAPAVPVTQHSGRAGSASRRPPSFQVLFALQDNRRPDLALDGVRTTFVRQPYLDLPLELHAEVWPAPGGGLTATVHHRADAVLTAVARDVAKHFAHRLQPAGREPR
jgi:hypothetical protein